MAKTNKTKPTVETPTVETPTVETPTVETPTVETPTVETPAEISAEEWAAHVKAKAKKQLEALLEARKQVAEADTKETEEEESNED